MEIKNVITGLGTYDQSKVDKTETEGTKTRRGKATESVSSGGDKINFSDEAVLRTEAYKAAMAAPDVRQDRVEELKAQVAAGTYQIDNHKIAEKLVKEELELMV